MNYKFICNFALVMAQELRISQEQQQKQLQEQQQRLGIKQVMVMRMLEMPIMQFEQNVQTEMDENPALEGEVSDNESGEELRVESSAELANKGDNENSDSQDTDDDKQDELDEVLDRLDRDDRLETSNYERQNNTAPDADQEDKIFGNTESFYDRMHEQVHEQSLTERQEIIMDYLIGNLDGDGLLRKDIVQLSDEIAIHEYIDVSEDEIEKVLTILQSFDPAGVGAQSLQQCLLIQIFRKNPTPITKLMHRVIDECYTEFTRGRWDKIQEKLHISEATADEVLAEIKKLNPRPGAALGEAMGRNTQQVTPDFIVSIEDDGTISFSINKGRVPTLHVSQDFKEMIDAYHQNPSSMTRRDKEALVYAQQKVNRSLMFIEAVKQRHQTMNATMRAIIKRQKDFFLSGDESDLHPMKLQDIASDTGFDVSTISRVCNSKYADTPWGVLQLKKLFSKAFDTGDGNEVSTREIKSALRNLVESEPKGNPLSDSKIADELKKMGYPIARRTVAKYREQLGIPISSMRK